MKEIIVNSTTELPKAAEQLLDYAQGRKKFILSGELGAGKTTFVQAFCANLGVSEPVSSPTFSLINEYAYTDPTTGMPASVYHMDLYRLNDLEEALHIGIEDYLDGDAYCLIEWPEIIEPILPEDCLRIKLEIISDSSRKILFL
jgi:tRNA threonylcarbamoyladenosine biosynthesis protein TsaE